MRVISAGSHCYPAWLLDRMGLRDAAYPFDWLWSDARMVADCLDDGFASFLDQEQHAVVDNRTSTHRLFQARYKTAKTFNHHNICNPETLDHFRRASSRFADAAASHEPTLFFVLGNVTRLPDEAFERLGDCLVRHHPNNHLLAVRFKPPKANSLLVNVRRLRNARLYEFTSTSEMVDGLAYANDADNMALEGLIRSNIRQILPLH